MCGARLLDMSSLTSLPKESAVVARDLQQSSAFVNADLLNVLIIAFHFPPHAGSSGLLRSLKYCRYLHEFGWQPAVLTLNTRAYEKIEARSLETVPKNVIVRRAFALDAKRHLGIGGRYIRYLALPDRWASWILSGFPAGLQMIRKHDIKVIYSTFPIASAAVLGLVLSRWTKLPWVLDLRDPMTGIDYPRDPLIRRIWGSIEKQCMSQASRVIFTADSTRRKYLERYPDLLTPEKCILIPNGYDEDDFRELRFSAVGSPPGARPIRLVHPGLLYPVERDPRPMFRALSCLKQEGSVSSNSLQIVLRAPGVEGLYRSLLSEYGIEDIIAIKPHIPYKQVLQECADADGLLLFQASNFDLQIPAKAYEYLRIGKPIFALTTQAGDTARLLRDTGGATIVDIASADDIGRGLTGFLSAIRSGTHCLPEVQKVQRYARRTLAGELARCLVGLCDESSVAGSLKP
jgi:glycosyltransferase involved in cell wall biosynthesis